MSCVHCGKESPNSFLLCHLDWVRLPIVMQVELGTAYDRRQEEKERWEFARGRALDYLAKTEKA
jgi:hypothetical protein